MAVIPSTQGAPQASNIAVQDALPTIGSASRENGQTVLNTIDAQLAKLFEDRNLLLAEGGNMSWSTATNNLTFSAALKLHINSQVAGGSPTIVDLASTTRAFSADGRMLYAVVNRTAGTATVTADATTLPSVVAANIEVVLIAKRVGNNIYFRNGFTLEPGQTSTFSTKQAIYSVSTDSTTTSGNATLQAFTTGVIRLTNASLTSVSGIPAGSSGQFLIIENKTGAQISINNEEATATAANRIQTGTSANVAMPNNSTFMFTYDSTSSRWQLSGGSGSGSGGGGSGKNYLSAVTTSQSTTPNTGNGDFSLGTTTGWSLGTIGTLTNNLPTGSPTFGSGASGNLSIATVSSGTLAGSYSLSYVSSAATTQGNMLASDAFNIDNEDQAKVLTWKFYYKAQTNPTNANWSGTSSNSFAVAVYDVTNSQWLGTSSNFALTQSSGIGVASGSFQTNITTTQLRFVVYNANATSGAITMYFDDFVVGPTVVVQGTPMSDPVAYTPSITGFSVQPTNKVFNWRRIGKYMIVSGSYTGGTNNGTAIQVPLPSGYSIDTNFVTSQKESVGRIWVMNASSSTYPGTSNAGPYPMHVDTTTPTVVYVASGSSSALFNKADSSVAASTSAMTANIEFCVPIAGWSVNTQMSSDTDTRVVSLSLFNENGYSQTTSATNTTVPYSAGNVLVDTHAAWNPSNNTWTCPVTGIYKVYMQGNVNNGTGTNRPYILRPNINGTFLNLNTAVVPTGTSNSATGEMEYSFKAGDTLIPQALYDQSGTFTINLCRLVITRLSGPSAIAASENVFAAYETSSGASINNSTDTTVIWNTKIQDTHNSMNTSTGIFTVPLSGLYEITVTNTFVSNSTGQRYITTNQSGSVSNSYRGPTMQATSAGATGTLNLSRFKCLAGDQLNTQVFQNSGGSLALSAAASQNYILIKRIGN